MSHNECSRAASRLLLVVLILALASTASAEWKEKVLYSFQGGTDGSTPAGGVIFDKAGNLYGLTIYGGSTACPPGWCGTYYQVSPPQQEGGAWTETILYHFNGQGASYALDAPLTFDSTGGLYTTAYAGSGGSPDGNVFRLRPPSENGSGWTIDVLYRFGGSPDGAWPTAGLAFDKNGTLYSTTQAGGSGQSCQSGCGTVFKVSP
jgi:hypothetical protein